MPSSTRSVAKAKIELRRRRVLFGEGIPAARRVGIGGFGVSVRRVLRAALDALLEEPLGPAAKALPPGAEALSASELGDQHWNVLAGDLLFPLLVLKESALAHNLAAMDGFCREHGVSLAPHGKTTMAPQLFERQLAAGAWGITAATISQARAYRAFGVERILLANELVQPLALAWVASELAQDPGFSFLCLVDSERGVALMEEALERAGGERPLEVLVELGADGARAGCRDEREALRVATAVAGTRHLTLAGVEGYEGVIGAERSPTVRANVGAFLARLGPLAAEIDSRGLFGPREEIVLSAGGSAFFDWVVERAAERPRLSRPTRLVLRSGCYLTHDDGFYERVSPWRSGAGAARCLRPALELWAEVLSRPEPGLAIAGFGKRDAPYDLGLPVPTTLVRRSGGARAALPAGALEVSELNDQHAFLRLNGVEPAVGDLVGCGVSHPCAAFDKWRLIPLVDDSHRVVGGIRTLF